MAIEEQERIKNEIQALAEKYGRDRSALLPILHDIQHKYHRISDFAMNEIAEALNIFPAEVQGVVTFYAFFNREPKGKIIVRLCNCMSCKMANSDAIQHQLENDLNIKLGETTDDGMVTLEETSCIGMCDQAPAMLVNDQPYTRLTPETAYAIIKEHKQTISKEDV